MTDEIENDKIKENTLHPENKLELPQDLFKKLFASGSIEIKSGESKTVFHFHRMSSEQDCQVWKTIKAKFPKNGELDLLSKTGCQKVVLNSNGSVETWS